MGLWDIVKNVWRRLTPSPSRPIHFCKLIRLSEDAIDLSGLDPAGNKFLHRLEWTRFHRALGVMGREMESDRIFLFTKDGTEYHIDGDEHVDSYMDLFFELTSRRCDLFDYTPEEKAAGFDGFVGEFRETPHPKRDIDKDAIRSAAEALKLGKLPMPDSYPTRGK